MEDLIEVLEKTCSNSQTDQNQAAESIQYYIQQDFSAFLKAISDVLFKQQNSPAIRTAAGLQLKSQLTARDELLRQQHQERWRSLPEKTKRYIKERLLKSLGTEIFTPSSAPQCVAHIAIVELPDRSWPGLIRVLTQNVTNTESEPQLRLDSLEAISHICQEIDQSSLESSDSERILEAITSYSVQDSKVSSDIKLAATNALLNFSENKIREISKLHQMLTFDELGEYLNVEPKYAERIVSQLIREERIHGCLNQIDRTVHFEYRKVPTHNLTAPLVRYCFITFMILGLAIITMLNIQTTDTRHIPTEKDEIKINFEHIDALNSQYPGLLRPKEMRIIKRRLEVMRDQVSILMLLGKSRDSHCKLDPTFCVGKTIANATQIQPGYIDASDPQLESKEIEKELSDSLSGNKYSIMIDSIESLPGSQVLNLFNFIDKDESNKRRGMLLFVVYTGSEFEFDQQKLKEAEIAEKVLVDKWLPFVRKDTLFSVISRMCGSIVKIH